MSAIADQGKNNSSRTLLITLPISKVIAIGYWTFPENNTVRRTYLDPCLYLGFGS